ncbi:MAG: multidrug transporter [Desulfobacterales bacterium GWB2_56_26]|nr:MAG: multidrug transporter [Desulfobacterales bacterium GWB2_56_26]
MEILLLGIYSFFVWLIFIKFKWLPWNITTQVIVITIPVIGIASLILLLNIYAPSSHDVRVINYVVAINPRVNGLVTEVPVEPNRPIKKGEVLFKIDPVPYQNEVKVSQAQLEQLKVQLITAEANIRAQREELKAAAGKREAIEAKMKLARLRGGQFKNLAETGAGNKFDYEQNTADIANLTAELASAKANESQISEILAAKTPEGEQDTIANIKAQIARAEAQLADSQWKLDQTVYHAPADGTVVSLALRPGAMAVPLPMVPAMNFVENEQWILAIFNQNEVRKVKPDQEAEISFRMHPGRIVKCRVDSIMWATAQGQLPIGGMSTVAGVAPVPPNSLAVRLLVDEKDRDIFLAAGARGAGAVYTDSGEMIHILRKVFLRVSAKLDWLILKLH